MASNDDQQSAFRPAGYAELMRRLNIQVIPNWHQSKVATSTVHQTGTSGDVVEEVYPAGYWPGDSIGDHLEFALKYDGVNLSILVAVFDELSAADLLDYIRSKPTSKYARRVWFLYEFLTNDILPLDDLSQGNYVDLLEADRYYTISSPPKVKRQRINNNLLGDRRFCPVVRRTQALRDFEAADLPRRCREIIAPTPPDILRRALSYLYTKETKSSFEIEHVTPAANRMERFVALLAKAEREDFCTKTKLIELQQSIVDERFRICDYRTNQNYVGEVVAWGQERVHFVGPKSESLDNLMAGLVSSHRAMIADRISPVIHAAVIAYGFVFLHPFEDGNGRIHRFLIHNVLALRKFTPEGVMFPVSAAMLKNPAAYDRSLEAFSRALMPLVDYFLDEEGRMTVRNETASWYRYIDMTHQAEVLFRFIETTIDTELRNELMFLANYDKTKKAIQEVVDMPDRMIDLFIRFCLQNSGRLSVRKRSTFSFLSGDEIARMEGVVQDSYGDSALPMFTTPVRDD